MKKQILSAVAVAMLAMAGLTSCATINSGASISNASLGSKVGEAKSSIILGLWSTKGKEANLRKACQNGGITKINQVEYQDEAIFFGLLINHTTRVYGE
jgi:hypothetical protein